jgi:threonine aldolase
MRQVGVIAAAGIVALQTMVDRLTEDHATARQLADGLTAIPGIGLDPANIQTNIVFFESPETMSGPEFIQRVSEQGVKVTNRSGRTVRAVTSRMVNAADITEALVRINSVVKDS